MQCAHQGEKDNPSTHPCVCVCGAQTPGTAHHARWMIVLVLLHAQGLRSHVGSPPRLAPTTLIIFVVITIEQAPPASSTARKPNVLPSTPKPHPSNAQTDTVCPSGPHPTPAECAEAPLHACRKESTGRACVAACRLLLISSRKLKPP